MGSDASKSDGSRSSDSEGSKSEMNVNVHVNLPGSVAGGANTNVHIPDEIKKRFTSSTPDKK
jgi:hypothetical protein